MDPNKALAEFADARQEVEDAVEGDSNDAELEALHDALNAADELFTWLAKGGFAPDWHQYTNA